MHIKSHNKGFTLIELLVVIAIIGVLSTIVLGSLSDARLKAKDTALLASVSEVKKYMELNYNKYGSYSNLFSGWISTAANCDSSYSGDYAPDMRRICNSIYSNTEANTIIVPGQSGFRFITGNIANDAKSYSIMVYLPSNKTYYCTSNNDKQSQITTQSYFATNQWNAPGCWSNY